MDALPRARDGRCRWCQRARQSRYRASEKGLASARSQAKTPAARVYYRLRAKIKRATNRAWAKEQSDKAAARQKRNPQQRLARDRARAARAKASLPEVTNVRAAMSLLGQIRRAE